MKLLKTNARLLMAATLFGVSFTSFAAEEKALMEPVKSSEEMFPSRRAFGTIRKDC